MSMINQRAAEFVDTKQGVLLDAGTLTKLLVAATQYVAGYTSLSADVLGDEVDEYTDLTPSEWSLIYPLFSLYVEREQAVMLEASRGMGVDVYGRAVSEIAQEIKQYEDELPKKAFYQPIISIGF